MFVLLLGFYANVWRIHRFIPNWSGYDIRFALVLFIGDAEPLWFPYSVMLATYATPNLHTIPLYNKR